MEEHHCCVANRDGVEDGLSPVHLKEQALRVKISREQEEARVAVVAYLATYLN